MTDIRDIANSLAPKKAFDFGRAWEYMAIQLIPDGQIDWMVDAGFVTKDNEGHYDKWTDLGREVAHELEGIRMGRS